MDESPLAGGRKKIGGLIYSEASDVLKRTKSCLASWIDSSYTLTQVAVQVN